MLKKTLSALAVMMVAAATVIAADVDLEDVKCVVAGRPVNPDKSAEYKDGKVYFCCGGCAGKFAKDKEKFSAKANHQLVASKQYEQKACPLSGQNLNPETEIEVAGTDVAFCCNKCKGAVQGKEDKVAKMKMVFSDKAFAKAFKKAKNEDEG